MFGLAANGSEVLGGVLFIIWSLTGYRAGQLMYCREPSRARRAIWRLTAYLLTGTVALLAQCVFAIMLWRLDWQFAATRIEVAIPLLLVPTVLTWWRSVPLLIGAAASTHSAWSQRTYEHNVSRPRAVVPVQVAGIAGFLDFWTVMVDRPAPPYARYLAVAWSVLGVAAVGLWFRQRRRNLKALQARPRPWRRASHAVAGLTVAALAVAVVIGLGTYTSRMPDELNMSTMPRMDWGGGPRGMSAMPHMEQMPGMGAMNDEPKKVPLLTGDSTGPADEVFTLVAAPRRTTLASGAVVEGWAFNGQLPGPTPGGA